MTPTEALADPVVTGMIAHLTEIIRQYRHDANVPETHAAVKGQMADYCGVLARVGILSDFNILCTAQMNPPEQTKLKVVALLQLNSADETLRGHIHIPFALDLGIDSVGMEINYVAPPSNLQSDPVG